MDVAGVVIRALLGVVFLVAGIAKLADPPGTREALAGFGVPARLVSWLAVLVPVAEVGVVFLLALNATARIGCWAALALLLAYAGGIARAMSRGEAPDCHCIGRFASEPAGPRPLLRSLALAGLAAIAALGSG
jgi:uncharacterized membrane protein YphA (DoxX/SURF4 family)